MLTLLNEPGAWSDGRERHFGELLGYLRREPPLTGEVLFWMARLLLFAQQTPHFHRGCVNAEHLMTNWYYFETADTERPGNVRPLSAKRQAREESKRQALINAAQRKAQRVEAMIRDLQKAVLFLDHSIEAELDSSWIKDTAHFAFPMSARALVIRRDNLKATIAALSDQFEKLQ